VAPAVIWQSRRFGTAAASRRARGSGYHAHARNRLWTDYNRPDGLAEAYAGLDRLLIISTVDPEPGKRGAQNFAAIDAAVRARVKHIVLMSAVGTRQEEEPAPAWTILRMNFYAEAFVQLAQAALKQGVLTGLAENRAAFVARDDVAAAAAGILVGDGHAGAIYNATGPERLSGAERAAVISEITGRPLAFRVITEEQLRSALTKAGLRRGLSTPSPVSRRASRRVHSIL
jgi:NAD(P)H dehydrogenase (quinone)